MLVLHLHGQIMPTNLLVLGPERKEGGGTEHLVIENIQFATLVTCNKINN